MITDRSCNSYFSALSTDEEDEILDEIIPHSVFKRKLKSSPKRQFIQSPALGQDDQIMPLSQGGVEQFAGAGAQEMPSKMEQFSSPLIQQQSFAPPSIAESQAIPESMFSQPQELQALGQQQSAMVMQDSPPPQVSQQTTNEGVLTEMPENAKNYNSNAVIETSMSDNGYKVTTDTREKANNLVKDVKNFGLWEYSADNTAASTDQTAKILQSKIEEADALLKDKDSASLNPSQMENAQGNKVDDILSLFNKGASNSKQLDGIQSEMKGFEALDTSAKGLAALGGVEKGLDLLGTGKSTDGQLGVNDATLVNDVGALENALGSQGMPAGGNAGGHEDVSVVTIPNTFSLEDEHGHKLDTTTAGVSGNHKSEKQNAVQFLKKLLKNKLESQALKMLLRQKKLKAMLKPTGNPTQSLKDQLALFLSHKDHGNTNEKMESASGPKVSKLDIKLLRFIKGMLKKGIKPQKKKGLSEGQLRLFMSALRVMSKNSQLDDTEDPDAKLKEAEDETEANKEKGDKEQEAATAKEAKQKSERGQKGSRNEAKENKEEKGIGGEQLKERKKKLKDIEAFLEHVKPTSRAGRAYFMDEDQPLSDSAGMSSNSLMKYLEHETALLDQFQEGSQISDPALQLKQLAGLMMKVANRAQTKDEFVDARRTTVKPTDGDAGEGEKTEAEGKKKGAKKGKKEDGKETGASEGEEEDEKTKKEGEREKKVDSENTTEKGTENGSEGKAAKDFDGESKKEGEETGEKEKEGKLKKESSEEEDNKNGNRRLNEKENQAKMKGESNDKNVEEAKEKEDGVRGRGNKAANENSNEKEREKKIEKEKETKASEAESNKEKQAKKLPELEKVKDNGKPIEKLRGKDENTSKFKESEAKEGKERKVVEDIKDEKVNENGNKDENKNEGNGEEDNEEKVKQLKSLKELSKLRDNKKIVSRIDSNSEKQTSSFQGVKEATAQNSEEQGNTANSGKGSGKDRAQSEEKSESGKTETDKEISKSKANDDAGKDKEAVNGEARQDTTEQFDLYVASRGKQMTSEGKQSQGQSSERVSEGKKLQPRLPFLNPGSAHQDVLENDASLQQYLMEKGDKVGALKDSKGEDGGAKSVHGVESESFDDKESNRLLQLKDVTAPHKEKLNKGANHEENSEVVDGIKASALKPNAVPPAGQGLPISAVKSQHSIKPMSKLELKKYHQLMMYKKLIGARNHHDTGLMEGGSLRHIAPAFADQLIDAPTVRLEALARLISMAKRHQKMIDVTASKKTLPEKKPANVESNSSKSSSALLTSTGAPLEVSVVKPQESRETSPAKEVTGGQIAKLQASSYQTTPSKEVTISQLTTSPIELETQRLTSTNVKTFTSPLISKSVLVPSRKQVLVPSFARLVEHETEAKPAGETSKLRSKVTAAEHDNGVDPADVTRSQLSKPVRPSIIQVMSMLGNQNSRTGPNATVDEKALENKAIGAGVEKGSGREEKKVTIMKNFFKQPTQPSSSIQNSFKELGRMLSEDERASRSNTAGKDYGEMSTAGKSLNGTSLAGSSNTTQGTVDTSKGLLSGIHNQEAGISSIRKETLRNIIRTLKTDKTSADLLLRKRSKIPRVRRKLAKKRRHRKRS